MTRRRIVSVMRRSCRPAAMFSHLGHLLAVTKPATGEHQPFFNIKPSTTGVTDIVEAPISTTNAVALPAEKADSTPVLPNQNAGVPQLSIAISTHLSRDFWLVLPGSVMRTGLSLIDLSCSSTFSISTSICSPFCAVPSLRPFFRGFEDFGLINLLVTLYSQSLLATSQSATQSSVPSPASGCLISRCGIGLCNAFSPKRSSVSLLRVVDKIP